MDKNIADAKINAMVTLLKENPEIGIKRILRIFSTLIENHYEECDEWEESLEEYKEKHMAALTDAVTNGIIIDASITKEIFPTLQKLFTEKNPKQKYHDFTIYVEDIFSVRIVGWYYEEVFARTEEESKVLSSTRGYKGQRGCYSCAYPYGDFSETYPISTTMEQPYCLILSCKEALEAGISLTLI